ncbi:MAG: OmpA family protein [Bryobacteraceae bacterium]
MRFIAALTFFAIPGILLAQANNPPPNSQTSSSTPIYRVQVVSHTVQAVSYRTRGGWTKIGFRGTTLAPKAKGSAQVQAQAGHATIKIDVNHLPAARTFGRLYLTYVLWAITPDGHAQNLGEILIDSNGHYSATLTTNLQAFGLIITAEPYFAVRMPSDVVVMENVIRNTTQGKWETVNAKYELLPRGQYTYHVPQSEIKPVSLNSSKKSPLELYEAINAVQIAGYAKADQYAPDIYQDAQNLLEKARSYQSRKEWNPTIMTAREAVQKAEDARQVSLDKQRDIAKREAHQRAIEAQQQATQAQQQAQEAQKRAQEAAAAQAAAEQQSQADARARATAEQAKAEAEQARKQAAVEAQKAQQAAAEANELRQQAVTQSDQLRQKLLQQFNSVLPTKQTPRGLVIDMNDLQFATSSYQLRQDAKLSLAKISGIIISHPGLNLVVEGYTDNTGSVAFNEKLSNQRADSVHDFLIQEGVNPQTITAVGYGEQFPAASNSTSKGRAQNRRVEIVVSGEVIGQKIGVPPKTAENAPPQPQTGSAQ